MAKINKAFIYEQLNKIHEEKHIDIAPYIVQMVGNSEIPYEVIVFINKHLPISNFSTYNNIYDKRKKSPLFKNIISENLPTEEKAIVLSSLLTQSLIGVKHANIEERESILDMMNVDVLLDALARYMNTNDDAVIDEVFDMYKTIFRTLFNR